jgi:hypothetical protein
VLTISSGIRSVKDSTVEMPPADKACVSTENLNPSAPRATKSRWLGRVVLVVGLVIAIWSIGGVMEMAHRAEQDRLERIDQAEDKYAVTYLRRVRDGEGGGIWRTATGTVLTCRIDGPVHDPTLACGADGLPPLPTR